MILLSLILMQYSREYRLVALNFSSGDNRDARCGVSSRAENVLPEVCHACSGRKVADSDKVVLYDKLIATMPKLERKGAANPYTALNGNMSTLLHQSKVLAIRLPEEEREKFIKRYKTSLFEAYGAVMKEYVSVPDALLSNTKELQKYLAKSYAYAKTLKPKATSKKR